MTDSQRPRSRRTRRSTLSTEPGPQARRGRVGTPRPASSRYAARRDVGPWGLDGSRSSVQVQVVRLSIAECPPDSTDSNCRVERVDISITAQVDPGVPPLPPTSLGRLVADRQLILNELLRHTGVELAFAGLARSWVLELRATPYE